MKTLAATLNLKLEYNQKNNFLIQKWRSPLSEARYKSSMQLLMNYAYEVHRIKYTLVYPDLTFPISPALQEWTFRNVFIPINKTSLKKVAFVVPKDVFNFPDLGFTALNQTLDEAHNFFEIGYFPTSDIATDWLFAKVEKTKTEEVM